MALTDVNGIWGFIRFVKQCNSSDIQPIAGVNLITDKQEVVILVENQSGYENLCRIISHIHDDHKQKISDIIRKYSSGLLDKFLINSFACASASSIALLSPPKHFLIHVSLSNLLKLLKCPSDLLS